MRIQGAGSAGSVRGELNVSGSMRWPLGRRPAHLIKIRGRRVVRHARMITFELAEVAIFCDLFAASSLFIVCDCRWYRHGDAPGRTHAQLPDIFAPQISGP